MGGGQGLLGRDGGVHRLRRIQAVVALAAGLDIFLAKIAAHGGGAANRAVE